MPSSRTHGAGEGIWIEFLRDSDACGSGGGRGGKEVSYTGS